MNTPDSVGSLPYRLSERCFREYEDIIAAAIAVLPSRFNLPPRPGKAQSTIEARLRDAMRSLHEYRWPTHVDMAKFDSLFPQLMVKRDGDDVCIELRRRAEPAVLSPKTTTELIVPKDKAVLSDVVHSIIILAHHGVLSGVKLEGMTKGEVWIPSNEGYDVAFVEKDGGVYVL